MAPLKPELSAAQTGGTAHSAGPGQSQSSVPISQGIYGDVEVEGGEGEQRGGREREREEEEGGGGVDCVIGLTPTSLPAAPRFEPSTQIEMDFEVIRQCRSVIEKEEEERRREKCLQEEKFGPFKSGNLLLPADPLRPCNKGPSNSSPRAITERDKRIGNNSSS